MAEVDQIADAAEIRLAYRRAWTMLVGTEAFLRGLEDERDDAMRDDLWALAFWFYQAERGVILPLPPASQEYRDLEESIQEVAHRHLEEERLARRED